MDYVRGEHAERHLKPAKQYPLGRVCQVEECETKLSRYNRTPWCSIHAEPLIAPVSATRPGVKVS